MPHRHLNRDEAIPREPAPVNPVCWSNRPNAPCTLYEFTNEICWSIRLADRIDPEVVADLARYCCNHGSLV
jgi:hypothetical protein